MMNWCVALSCLLIAIALAYHCNLSVFLSKVFLVCSFQFEVHDLINRLSFHAYFIDEVPPIADALFRYATFIRSYNMFTRNFSRVILFHEIVAYPATSHIVFSTFTTNMK